MAPLRALAYARQHRPRFLEELKAFIRFPTISSQPAHARDLKRCAAWLAGQLRRVGLENVKVIPTRGHPIVYGAWQRNSDSPTVLVYGHYDVLPADPLEEWKTQPFEPVVIGDNLHGRGACDDKGQLFAHIKALESYLMTERTLPVNVKCLFEGEEELDSPHFAPFVQKNRRVLSAKAVVMSDTRMLAPDRPAISYAERGTLRVELEVHGPRQDLHSGNFGGAIHNPLQALCEMLASFHDANGRVAIPGFYNSVRTWGEEEREFMAHTGPRDGDILRDAQVSRGWGERGYSLYERTTLRPALTLNGIVGGHQGSGVKAVIPSRALAKLSFRLVPDQDPQEIGQLFRDHIQRISPPAVKCTVRLLSSAKPALLNRDHPSMRAAAFAYRKGFGSSPVFLRSGGTIPVVDTFQQILGIPTVLMGFALPDDRIHAPNEKFHLPNFYNGIATCIWFLKAAGGKLGSAPAGRREEEWSVAYGD
jgi:acetylornithine deacetylase/succinyl-diaminopimelate desuccinylase-like protein